MVLTGMSELHLQLLRERLKRRDKVEVETHEPKIPYRETIQANGDGSYRHKKQFEASRILFNETVWSKDLSLMYLV
jgi:translation elongation factor EF-G